MDDYGGNQDYNFNDDQYQDQKTIQIDMIQVNEDEVPNVDVQEYNKRANEVLEKRVNSLSLQQIPEGDLFQFIEKLKAEITEEVYNQMLQEQLNDNNQMMNQPPAMHL
jgi:hypothetical protein